MKNALAYGTVCCNGRTISFQLSFIIIWNIDINVFVIVEKCSPFKFLNKLNEIIEKIIKKSDRKNKTLIIPGIAFLIDRIRNCSLGKNRINRTKRKIRNERKELR